MNILDIDSWSANAVKSYLANGTPLNDSITKIATQHGLNRDQISRVVEAANTDTYVQLFNKTADKYIQFIPADMEKIAGNIFGEQQKEAAVIDYDEPPVRNDLEIELSTPFIKTAEVAEENKTNTEALHEYYKLAAIEESLKDKMEELETTYQFEAASLASMIKQAVLQGTSFGDVEKALTSVYDNAVVKINLNEIQTKLAEELFPKKLNTVVTQAGTVNIENPVVKQAGMLVKCAEEYKDVKIKHDEAHKEIVENIKTGGLLGTLLGKPQRTAATGLLRGALIAGGTAAVALPAGAAMQRKKEQIDMTRQMMSQVPTHYAR
jgi:hypothetical protein